MTRNPKAAILLLPALLAVGCMDNEIVAPEALEDAVQAAVYFPGRGDSWEGRAPEVAGFDAAALQTAVDYALSNEAEVSTDVRSWLEARAGDDPEQGIVGPVKERGPMNGVIVRSGYLVAEWGDTEQIDMAFSVTKSFLSTVVGLAVDGGLIPSTDDPIGTLVRDGGYDDAHNASITWDMALRQTAEWEGTLFDMPDRIDRRAGANRELQPPGTFWEYNDVRVNRLALSALRVWREPLPDVLDREILGPIGASRTWRWHGYRTSHVDVDGTEMQSVSGGGHWGGGLWIHSRDLARYGLLFLREGSWRDEQLLSAEWVQRATAPGELQPTYGYLWWVNAGRELWPALPESAYAARGGGGHVLLVVPTHELVVVVRWLDGDAEAEFFARILEALDSPAG